MKKARTVELVSTTVLRSYGATWLIATCNTTPFGRAASSRLLGRRGFHQLRRFMANSPVKVMGPILAKRFIFVHSDEGARSAFHFQPFV